MTWVLTLGTGRQALAITRAIQDAGHDVHPVTAPDATDSTGVVVCTGAASDQLPEILLATTAAGSDAIVVTEPGTQLDPWSVLGHGAADVLGWNGDAHPILARVARIREVGRMIASAAVARVMVGKSPELRQALRDLVTAARYGTGPILLLGETGTGKELAARVAHQVSRVSGNLVVVDCTTIVPTLSGSELFGHERGAFTGAVSVRTGACAAANGGTLFLDEVGELPLELQPALLRVLQEGTYKRVGGDSWLRTRFRLICATHRSLPEELAAGRFRADLYFRIAASVVTLPPLRERTEDVIPLFRTFLRAALGGTVRVALSPAVAEALQRRDYPGNLRDLRHLAHRVAARHVGAGPVTPGDLPPADRPGGHPRDGEADPRRHEDGARLTHAIRAELRAGRTLKDLREHVAEVAVAAALEDSGGNVRAAASRLGVTERALHLRRAQRRG